MKKILVFGMILVIVSLLIPLNFNKVEAYSGELDPENYITMPSGITVSNGVGTGTISLASGASNYTISYQKVDVTASEMTNIQAKGTEITNYVSESNETLSEKEANVQALYEAYQELNGSGSADPEELQEAQNKYDEAYADYEEFYNTVSENTNRLQNELLALVPDFTNSWTETTNSSNNVQLDFSNYSGEAHFILWVKIDDGSNTYYDMETYTTIIQAESEDEPADEPTTEPTGEWTDFSRAEFELKKEGTSKATIEISGVTPSNNSSYYLFITSDANEPNVTSEDSETRIDLQYDSNTQVFKTNNSQRVASYVELNQDLYASILEVKYLEDEEDVVIYGQELERYEEPKYSDAFFATFMADDGDQIVTNFTHSGLNDRRIQIKVGKITDTSILRKIQNQNSSGFADLLSYAKSNNGIYDEIVDADKNDTFAIEYNAGRNEETGNEIIDLNNLEDGAYYFLYVRAEDENGRYITQEAATLAQASVNSEESWGLMFYGSSDFEWTDFGDVTPDDDTTAPGTLPQTGANIIVWTILGVVLVGGGTFTYIKYKKNNF